MAGAITKVLAHHFLRLVELFVAILRWSSRDLRSNKVDRTNAVPRMPLASWRPNVHNEWRAPLLRASLSIVLLGDHSLLG